MTFILRPRFLYKSFVCLTGSHALNESVDTARDLLPHSFSETGSVNTFHGLGVHLEPNLVILDPASVDIQDGHQHWIQLHCPARIVSAVFAHLALLFLIFIAVPIGNFSIGKLIVEFCNTHFSRLILVFYVFGAKQIFDSVADYFYLIRFIR